MANEKRKETTDVYRDGYEGVFGGNLDGVEAMAQALEDAFHPPLSEDGEEA